MNFKEMVIYQLYPKSFMDSNGDGIGDIQGILQKIPYLRSLGVDMIWMNPIFLSPQKDNGYDITDYKTIDPVYGTMEDVEKLISELDANGMGLMFDMVFNHVSNTHEWFQKALAGDPEYRDYFYIRPTKADGSLPNNWQSKFGGPAWAPFGDTGEYYLALYDQSQADLNWHNPKVRQALYEVVRFWMKKGIKGFRFDVINVIGKDPSLIDSTGDSTQEKSLYTDTPIVHDFIREMNQASFGSDQNIVTVGEMSSTSVENSIHYANESGDQLTMIFSFHHLKVDYKDGEKWSSMPFDFQELKDILNEWQVGMEAGKAWNALFWNNHDQPRANDRFGDPIHYPYETATMLAQTIHLMRGTPYIYMGEEIGMTDPKFKDIEDYRDIETHNAYQTMLDQGFSVSESMDIIQKKSRDNSRVPMQWTSGKNAGFTEGTPWIGLSDQSKVINVENEIKNPSGIFAYYQQLIALRKKYKIISEGSYQPLLENHPQVFAYKRHYKDQTLICLNNFYGEAVELDLGFNPSDKTSKLIGNGPLEKLSRKITLKPYESAAFWI